MPAFSRKYINMFFHQPLLIICILQLVLALTFHAKPWILGWSSTPMNIRIEELRKTSALLETWRTLALRCLQGTSAIFCGSIPSLQAMIMLLLDGQQEPLALDTTLVSAISGAQRLGLHRLGNAKLAPHSSDNSAEHASTFSMEPHVRVEIAIRIW